MPRPITIPDPFSAIADPTRRQIIYRLAIGELPVGDLVRHLRIAQSQTSKHLKVLKEAGLVRVRKQGRQRFYRLDPKQLKTVHDWVKRYEPHWNDGED